MNNTIWRILTARLAALMVLMAAPVKGSDEVRFERPASLRPAIAFWTRVYGEVDSLSGFVHDSRNLKVIYETLKFNWYDNAQLQEEQIEAAVQRYRSTLRVLAAGKREDLTAREQKVLALWGEEVSSEQLEAAAEQIRFQRGQADRIRDGIVRAGAWEKRILKTLRDAGLPEELAALPHVESSYNHKVQSHAGAVGLWQFTRFTGRHYLRVDNVVDERLDPLKSTDGAVRLLQRYHSKLNSWPLTITAYNHGLSGVRRAIEETGSTDIGDIVERYNGPRFGFASRNYYAAFLAAGDVTRNAEAYFGPLERQPPEHQWIVKVPSYMSVAELIEQLELDTEVTRELNPALQQAVWSGRKYVPKGYLLRLPGTTGASAVTALLTRVQGYAEQLPDLFYRVEIGDTLSDVALRYKHSVRDLMALNNLSNADHIRVGQKLRLYAAALPEAIQIAAMEAERDGVDPVLEPAPEVTGDSAVRVR
ncbi:MAG: transglycosylase SLT domain-containing protein [Gammaproteobacteria bacterium]|jgi:membrane-bound lytic murein transglycosylase D